MIVVQMKYEGTEERHKALLGSMECIWIIITSNISLSFLLQDTSSTCNFLILMHYSFLGVVVVTS